MEAANQEAARQEAARQTAARAEAAKAAEVARSAEAANLAAAAKAAEIAAAAARREAALQEIGRQLSEEAARREAAAAARQAARPDPSASPLRRGRLFGRIDSNAELVLYAEAWSRKLQLNQTLAMVGEAAKQPHTPPIVTVAVRSDGSVESVTFVRSSGVPALDDAVRRIVHSQAPYAAFSPALLSSYDVIEIRRTWQFDSAVRLY